MARYLGSWTCCLPASDHAPSVAVLCHADDGKIAIASRGGNQLKVWNVSERKLLWELNMLPGGVGAFQPCYCAISSGT